MRKFIVYDIDRDEYWDGLFEEDYTKNSKLARKFTEKELCDFYNEGPDWNINSLEDIKARFFFILKYVVFIELAEESYFYKPSQRAIKV